MDSINQTSGRANRNGVKEKGIVKLFILVDENNNGIKYSSYIYPESLLKATEDILEGRTLVQEKDIYEINQRYFEKVNLNLVKSDDTYNSLNKAIGQIDFKKIGELFELINKSYNKEDIIINLNDESQQNLDIIANPRAEYQDILNAWRVLNKYKISVDMKEIDSLNCMPFRGINVLDKEYYDEKWGIKKTESLVF